MSFGQHLQPGAVLIDPSTQDKWDLLDQMVTALAGTGGLPQELHESAREAVRAREHSKSTGMDQGVAVPHAAVEGLNELAAGLALIPEGLDFDSLDGLPTQFVVLLLVPKEERVLHVRTLAEVARRLGGGDFRDQLLETKDPERVVSLWAD